MDYRRENSEDWPIYSRLFVVCEKNTSENQLREAFSQYGTIEDVRIPVDRNTGEPKGFAYIKFSKTSEAANASESMNLKKLPNSNKPLRIMVAANRSEIQSDEHDDDKYKRLFINIPRSADESTVQNEFQKFGEIETIIVQRDRHTRANKGFAYVKFRRFSEAARAFEQCEKKFKALFAQPKKVRCAETRFESSVNNIAAATSSNLSIMSEMHTQPRGFTRINFLCDPRLTSMHVYWLFDIVPGMVDCQYYVDMVRNCGKGSVEYSNPTSAAYAVDKLDTFEYPPGQQIFVKPDINNTRGNHQGPNITQSFHKLKRAVNTNTNAKPDLAQLADAIAEATRTLKMATGAGDGAIIPNSDDLNYCSVKLPPPKPLAHVDSQVAKRCFLVCKPQPPPLSVLRDIFCRFGNLISVYTLPNKTVGYASYANATSADNAIKLLHGAEICAVRIKVLEAEDENPNKRKRYDDKD